LKESLERKSGKKVSKEVLMILEIRRPSTVLKTEAWVPSHAACHGFMATVNVKLKCVASLGLYCAIFEIKHEKPTHSTSVGPRFGVPWALKIA
jgi:hypothetical protein